MSGQRILVLGSEGYVGSRLVRRLAALDDVSAVGSGRSAGGGGPGYDYVRCDAARLQAVEPLWREADAVVSCVRGSNGPNGSIVRNARVLAHCLGQWPKPLVYLSSMAAYGDVEGEIDEMSPLKGDLGGYSRAKAQADRLLEAEGAAVLRPGIIYGSDGWEWSGRFARLLVSHRLGDLGAAGDGFCNLIHVDDVVSAVVKLLLEAGHHAGPYNLASSGRMTWNEYFVAFAIALGAVPVRRFGSRRLALEFFAAYPLKVADALAGCFGVDKERRLNRLSPNLIRLFGQRLLLVSNRADGLGVAWTDVGDALAASAAALQSGR